MLAVFHNTQVRIKIKTVSDVSLKEKSLLRKL